MNCKIINEAPINDCAGALAPGLFTDIILIFAQTPVIINAEYNTTVLPAQVPIIVTTEHNEANT